jgi:hypothetical protein
MRMGRSHQLRRPRLVLGASVLQGGTRARDWWTRRGGEEPRILLRATVMLAPQDQVLKEIEPRQLHHILREKRRRGSNPENRAMGIP